MKTVTSWRVTTTSLTSSANPVLSKPCVGQIAAAAALALSLAFASAASSQTMQVHFIDVGQGAATLIEFPCAAILVDTGGENNGDFDSNSELLSYLDDFFGRRSDLKNTLHSLMLSHPHIDHTRGVKDVLGRYKILNAVTNGQEEGSGKSGQIALHRRASASAQRNRTGDQGKFEVAFPVGTHNQLLLFRVYACEAGCKDRDALFNSVAG